MNDALDSQIPEEFCPYCKKSLIKVLSAEEQKKYNVQYIKEKIGISNWDSVYAWQCPFCSKTWKR